MDNKLVILHLTMMVFISQLQRSVVTGTQISTPNILIMVADDLGYADLGCFGNNTLRTPNLDKLATQGVKLTHSLAVDSLCTPSRAAFLTGRYPIRFGMASSPLAGVILFTASEAGLPQDEVTFAEIAKQAGYKTALLGKWHLGWSVDPSKSEHHPLDHGFDYFYGIPLSNTPDFGDQGRHILLYSFPDLQFQLSVTFILVLLSSACLMRMKYLSKWFGIPIILIVGLGCGVGIWVLYNYKFLNSFFVRNYEVVEQPIHLPSVTRKLVIESEEFLEARHNDSQPFLLLVSWLHVHSAQFTAPAFAGHSQHGPYGDAVEEMDWGVGKLVEMLDRFGMTNNTLVFFTSDHGGSVQEVDEMGRTVGGFNGILKGKKGDGSLDGAIRAAGIFQWPGKFPAGYVISEPTSLMDLLPTIASLLHIPLPHDVVIDGKSLLPLLNGEKNVSEHTFLFHYCQDQIHAVRYRPRTGNAVWKLALREPDNSKRVSIFKRCETALYHQPPLLYEMNSDPSESKPLPLELHKDVVSAMLTALDEHKQGIVPVPTQFTLTKILWRPWDQPCCNFPMCRCEDEKFRGRFKD